MQLPVTPYRCRTDQILSKGNEVQVYCIETNMLMDAGTGTESCRTGTDVCENQTRVKYPSDSQEDAISLPRFDAAAIRVENKGCPL